MIKKVFCDIDGTLTNSLGQLTNHTINKIKQLKNRGIDFVITTGRPIAGLQELFKQYGRNLSCICVLGGDYHDDTGKRIFDIPIDLKAVEQVYNIKDKYENNGLTVFARDDFIVCKELKKYLKDVFNLDEVPTTGNISQWMKGIHYVDNIEEIVKLPVYKMEFYTDNFQQSKALYDHLKEIKELNLCISTDKNIEITAKNASKGEMIRLICQQEGLSLDQVVTIGDSGNDLSMLRGFKNSVAMANATDRVKAACNYITDDNDHEGVSKVIDKILNGDYD